MKKIPKVVIEEKEEEYQKEYNVEGKPLKLNDLNIEALAEMLHKNNIRTTQGKLIQPLHQGHLDVLAVDARYKVLAAGRRFAKTLLCVLTAMAVLMQPNRRVFIVAPDYSLGEKVFRELYSIFVLQMKLIRPGKPGGGRATNQKGNYSLTTPWNSIVEVKSMENPDSLAGEALDLVIIDEAALQSNVYDIWSQMIRPTLMDKAGSAMIISSPRGKNDFYKMYLLGQKGMKQKSGLVPITKDLKNDIDDDFSEWASFIKTSYDNPLLMPTPEQSKAEIDKAYREAVNSGKLTQFKQEYLCDFESVADTAFEGFIANSTDHKPYANVIDYSFHPDSGKIFAACDHNYARPASTIFAQVNSYGDIVIFDECFTAKTTPYKQAQQIQAKEKDFTRMAHKAWQEERKPVAFYRDIKVEKVIADISGNQVALHGRAAWDDMQDILGYRPVGLKQPRETGSNMIRQFLQYPLTDIYGVPVIKANGDPETRPKLFISSNCVNTIFALSTARFKKSKVGMLKEDYDETPEGHEGLLDALRYLLVYLFHDTKNHMTIMGGF